MNIANKESFSTAWKMREAGGSRNQSWQRQPRHAVETLSITHRECPLSINECPPLRF